MARRMMLRNMLTGRWERVTVYRFRMPWERAWTRLRWLVRYMRRHSALLPKDTATYDLDPETLEMRDRRAERRRERFQKAARAVFSMIDMQKFIG